MNCSEDSGLGGVKMVSNSCTNLHSVLSFAQTP